METRREELVACLRQQVEFSAGYSPLYEQIFQTVGGWLEFAPEDAAADWYVNLAQDRAPIDAVLLLVAGLHRSVLAGETAVAQLAQFYPTVGGTVPVSGDRGFEGALHSAILSLRENLEPVLRTSTVQTNETARGLSWLWPLSRTHWPAVHLLELGASAGLNLLADWRSYQLISEADPEGPTITLGRGRPPQFTNWYSGDHFESAVGATLPDISSRTGLDLAPFHLRNRVDDQTLASFVWADQTVRMERLMEGIAVLHAAEALGRKPELLAVNLPDQLGSFFAAWTPRPTGQPIVIYNTIVSMYLDGGAAGLRQVVEPWAAAQDVAVLWLQWEPPQEPEQAPLWGWAAWTADLWRNANSRQRSHEHALLAWVHPHAKSLQWVPGTREWLAMADSLY